MSSVPAMEAAAPTRPNILILMADNWAWPHAGAYGDPVVKTPTFDRLARDGILFRHAFCVAPSCAPARAAFLTGQTIHRLDDAANLHGRFPARHKVFTEALEEAGYSVGYSGKGWGPGNVEESGRTSNPAGTKYDDFAAFLKVLPYGRPFCFWFSSRHPHIPWEDGAEQKAAMPIDKIRVPKYLPDVPEVRDNIADYYCEVQLFDRQCEEILDALDLSGRRDNTLVIMTGDNGWQMPHGLAHIYDAGTHVPLAMWFPRRVPAGAVSDEFVNFDDFAPTFLQMAKVDPWPEMTGRSLWPLDDNRSRIPRDTVFLSRERHANVRRGDRSYPVRAIRTKEFLYIRNFEPDLWPAGDPEYYFAVGEYGDVDFTKTKQYLLDHRNDPAMKKYFEMNFAKRPAEELYDLVHDPDQTRNVADLTVYHARKLRLAQRLADWMKTTGDPRVVDPHDKRWDRAPYYGGRPKGRLEPQKPIP